jgi:hypothetical protein
MKIALFGAILAEILGIKRGAGKGESKVLEGRNVAVSWFFLGG